MPLITGRSYNLWRIPTGSRRMSLTVSELIHCRSCLRFCIVHSLMLLPWHQLEQISKYIELYYRGFEFPAMTQVLGSYMSDFSVCSNPWSWLKSWWDQRHHHESSWRLALVSVSGSSKQFSGIQDHGCWDPSPSTGVYYWPDADFRAQECTQRWGTIPGRKHTPFFSPSCKSHQDHPHFSSVDWGRKLPQKVSLRPRNCLAFLWRLEQWVQQRNSRYSFHFYLVGIEMCNLVHTSTFVSLVIMYENDQSDIDESKCYKRRKAYAGSKIWLVCDTMFSIGYVGKEMTWISVSWDTKNRIIVFARKFGAPWHRTLASRLLGLGSWKNF